jgi:serine/threonine-protein kinase RsbW
MPDANPPNSASATLSVANQPQAIEQAQVSVVQALERNGYPKASLFAVRLALHEAMSNAFQHGHRGRPDLPVTLTYNVDAQQTQIMVEDQGPGFDPAAIPDPTLDENLERGSGRGLLLIRAYMSEAEYLGRGNVLRMVYRRPSGT